MKAAEKKEMYQKIFDHGERLLKIFPDATVRDPIALCKRLRKIENQAHKVAEDACNGVINVDQVETLDLHFENALDRLLQWRKAEVPVFINHDPRGYALKIREAFAKDLVIYKDWGGYGIICPDFTPVRD